MKQIGNEKTMSVKEIAAILNMSERTIQIKAKELYPELIKEREESHFNEIQVTAIKNACEKKFAVETKEDKKQILKRAFEILNDENEELKQKVIEMAPKVESFEALQKSEKTMSITDAAKHFGLHPKSEVFPFLRDACYLTTKDLPTQRAIDEKILSVREAKGNDGVYRPQAVVEAGSLELWRVRIAPRIMSRNSRNFLSQ